MPLLPPPLLPAAGAAADSMPKIMAQKNYFTKNEVD
jgi:hypothetical protein